MPWTVVTETLLIKQADEWSRDARHQLFAIQDRFREEGPDAFALDAAQLADAPSWDELDEPCTIDFFVELRKRLWRIELDILPGRTVVFRHGRRL